MADPSEPLDMDEITKQVRADYLAYVPCVEERLAQLHGAIEGLYLMSKALMADKADGTTLIGEALRAAATSMSENLGAVQAALYESADTLGIECPIRYRGDDDE